MKSKKLPAKAAEAKKMKAFLKAEGWISHQSTFWAPDCVWMPPKASWVCGTDEAYSLAMKRKAARERAALKRAGWYRCNEGGYHRRDESPSRVVGCFTRSEALQKLATARRSRKDPIPNPKSQSRKP